MASYTLSGPQLQAVEERGTNLLVAAGAGSGKTTVLVERVLRRLLQDESCDIDKLLVLTFTNAAAAEMRQRIEQGLLRRLQESPGQARFTRQLALLQQAPITTIHSFCLELLRRHFYLLGLDAGFRIPAETERAILQEETLADFLEAAYDQEDALLSALADSYGGRHGDAALGRLIVQLYHFSRSQPHPDEWLATAAASFGAEQGLDDYAWSSFLLDELKHELALARQPLEAARTYALEADIPAAWLQLAGAEIAAFNQVLEQAQGLEALLPHMGALEFAKLPTAKEGDAEQKKEFRRLRDAAKKALRELQKRYCRRSVAAIAADLRQLAPLMARLCQLVTDYAAALAQEKRRRNLLDFDDMEHFALALLEDEANGVAAALRTDFVEVLIDEYQDINPVQAQILQLVQRGDNCFAVGDVKQSIYRFRLADPGLFIQKYHAYGQGEGGRRIDLNRNYRSEGGLIAGVNFLFRQLMTVASAELDYDEAAELKAGREATGARPEFWLIEQQATATEAVEDEPPAEEPEAEHALAAEARLIAQRALELRAEGYGFGDMVVLLRATKNREQVLLAELKKLGVPALAAGQPDDLETPEVALMLALLTVIDNPLQEIELAAVLRSPLFGFTLDELVQIRFAAQGELLSGLEADATLPPALATKARHFLEQLTDWRQSLRERRISELIWAIYEETGLYHLAGALPQGRQRQANLLRLCQRAREYEQSSYRGLFRFLLFLEDSRGRGGREGQPAATEQALRIMSIHRSKGLEFPVVFLAGLGSQFSLVDERQDVVWHRSLGLGPKVVERQKRLKFPSLAHEAVARKLHAETLAEEMRVLYVALTRARERLILTAGVKDAAKTLTDWAEAVTGQGPRLDGALLQRDKRPLDWLGKALLRHADAAELRAHTGLPESAVLPAEGGWQMRIVPKSALQAPPEAAEFDLATLLGPKKLPPTAAAPLVDQVLSYRYPYSALCDTAAKWTVSELNRLATSPPQALREEAAPLAMGQEEPPATAAPAHLPADQAATRGNAYHKLLQHLDFRQTADAAAIAGQITALSARRLLLPAEAALVDAGKILRFCASELGQRVVQSGQRLREATFTYALPARELVEQAAPEDKLVLQGMIDLAFAEPDGWVVVDYKTGGYGKSPTELKALYATQLGYYARALADIRRVSVKESWLYFLDLELALRLA